MTDQKPPLGEAADRVEGGRAAAEEELRDLRAALQKASSFSAVALFVSAAALALSILGLFMPLR